MIILILFSFTFNHNFQVLTHLNTNIILIDFFLFFPFFSWGVKGSDTQLSSGLTPGLHLAYTLGENMCGTEKWTYQLFASKKNVHDVDDILSFL